MNDTTRLDRSDRIGMYISVALVVVGAAIAIIAAVQRVREVAAGGGIPVVVPLSGETVSLPLGPEGANVEAVVETATVRVSDPAPATLFALYAQPIWTALFTVAAIGVAALFFLKLARSHAFAGGAARLAYVGSGIVTIGWYGSTILTNMTTNGTLSAISDYTYESTTFEAGLGPFLVVLVLAAIGAALQIGERLQRETEGLV